MKPKEYASICELGSISFFGYRRTSGGDQTEKLR